MGIVILTSTKVNKNKAVDALETLKTLRMSNKKLNNFNKLLVCSNIITIMGLIYSIYG